MLICPKDCPDRSPTCHGNCERYKEGREKLDEINKKIFKEREIIDAMHHIPSSPKLMKHSHVRSRKK